MVLKKKDLSKGKIEELHIFLCSHVMNTCPELFDSKITELLGVLLCEELRASVSALPLISLTQSCGLPSQTTLEKAPV